ncbi:glycosyltransferase [Fimbriiglobus ruber]|nr:glycosyltransferase [Fimbriiglobus ruber]
MNTLAEQPPRRITASQYLSAAPVAVRPAVAPVVFDTRVVTGSGGGPDKTILNSPRFLSQVGYKMICGYLHPPGDPGYQDIVKKADRYGAPLVSIPDRGPWDWRVITELIAVCRREKVAIWHGHDYKTNALGLLLKQFWPMRLVTTVHGWVHHTSRTPLYYRLDQICLPKYEKVICVSEDLFEACMACGVPASACVLLENAIDTDDYRRRRATAAAKAALGFPTDGMLIGAVGRLAPEKAFDLLIRAIHDLNGRGVNVRLVVVGEGDDRPRLEALARDLGVSDRVILAGWQSDVRTYFEAMDVFALSSLREGLPNVLLEAMALEVPVVASRIAGIPRLIQDGRNGFLVDAGDLPALTRSLYGLLTNPDLRDLFRQAARRTIDSRYSFPVRMQRLKRIYDELLTSGG